MTEGKPLIYIAGPISKGWLPDNIRMAVEVAELVYLLDMIPLVPHTHGTLWEFVSPHDHAFWMDIDREFVRRCDGLIRLPGESAGADLEVGWMHEHGRPVLEIESIDRPAAGWADIRAKGKNEFYKLALAFHAARHASSDAVLRDELQACQRCKDLEKALHLNERMADEYYDECAVLKRERDEARRLANTELVEFDELETHLKDLEE